MMAFFDSLIQREIEGWDSPLEETTSSDSDGSDVSFELKIKRVCRENCFRGLVCGK